MRTLLTILILSLAGPLLSKAQENTGDTTGVIIHTDQRLSVVIAAMKPRTAGSGTSASGRSGVIRSGRGFRVQIYNGNDRNKANAIKVDFIRRFPEIRTYMSYIQPQFRVKVGDFRSRAEAQKFLQQIGSLYTPAMVVPDIIVINTFRDDP